MISLNLVSHHLHYAWRLIKYVYERSFRVSVRHMFLTSCVSMSNFTDLPHLVLPPELNFFIYVTAVRRTCRINPLVLYTTLRSVEGHATNMFFTGHLIVWISYMFLLGLPEQPLSGLVGKMDSHPFHLLL